MFETVRRRWAPRVLYLVIYLLLVIMYFGLYGTLSERYGSENVMPVFVGLAPLVVIPLVLEFRHRIFIHGWQCPACNFFLRESKKGDNR